MNYPQLCTQMIEKGVTKRDVANRLNMSEQALYNKLNGTSEFKNSEIKVLAKILDLSMNDVNIIFFDGGVN